MIRLIRWARRPTAAWVVLFLVAWAATGCGAAERDPLAGAYVVKGGGAPLDVYSALLAEFRQRHPTVNFRFEDIGSAPAMVLAASGEIDLATSSADPSPAIAPQLQLTSLGVTGTAVVVSALNPVAGLTRAQIRGIFTGEIADWAAVGAPAGKIFVGIRNPGSAIRKNFEAYVFGSDPATYVKDVFVVDDIDQTLAAVSSRHDVISIITVNNQTLGDSRIRLLAVDGVKPTKETLASGSYPIRRPLYLAYRKAGVKPAIRAFLDFVESAEGQRIIAASAAG